MGNKHNYVCLSSCCFNDVVNVGIRYPSNTGKLFTSEAELILAGGYNSYLKTRLIIKKSAKEY